MRSPVISAALIAFLAAGVLPAGDKLSPDERVELLRGLMAEYATVKTMLPRSKKPLVYESTGAWDKEKWDAAGKEFGPAARLGDLVQITRVAIEDKEILLEINGGVKGKKHWYDHLEVGMGNRTSPVSTNQNTSSPGGTYIALVFPKTISELQSAEVKKMLAPILDFEKHSATENFVETLPAPVQEAIKQKKAIEGMDREQVLLALGKPISKSRETKDGVEMEDWVYGRPPGRITFVTFGGSKVVKVKEAYAGLGGSVAPPLPPQ